MNSNESLKTAKIRDLYTAGVESVTATVLGIGIQAELMLSAPSEVIATTAVALGTLALDAFRRVDKVDRLNKIS